MWTRVSNDRVFLLLKLILSSNPKIASDEICHFASDGFCLFASKIGELTSINHLEFLKAKIIFAAPFDTQIFFCLLNSARGYYRASTSRSAHFT